MLPVTVGTSSSLTTICEPKHSASTERSIRLTAAAASTRWAMRAMPSACLPLSEINSLTVIPISCTAGNERMGSAFLRFASPRPRSHAFMSKSIVSSISGAGGAPCSTGLCGKRRPQNR